MADKPLSDEELDEIYRRMIDIFIDRANEFAETQYARGLRAGSTQGAKFFPRPVPGDAG
jgi:hypothetical protein